MSELLIERPPEAEIYGRSLSTIYRLGAFMVDKTLNEAIASPEADQARVEFYTSVEEGFGTDTELGGGLEVRDFDERPIINGRVMSKDLKTAVSDMTEAGLTCAIKTAEKDVRFHPQLVRSRWDHQNALIVDEMAKGNTDYNTRIVVSPFPEEAASVSGNDYWRNIGYVPHLKRGFVQLYHVDGNAVIAGSLSFDGSNKQQLREIFRQNGVQIPEDEVTDNWLKYAITANLSEDQAKALALAVADQAGASQRDKTTNTVDVTREYRQIMDQVFNQSYIHISESLFREHQTDGTIRLIHQLADKAHHFNTRYANALYRMRANPDKFTDDDSVVLHELLVYSTIEMMRALSLNKNTSKMEPDYAGVRNNSQLSRAHLESMNPIEFQVMLSNFGAEGARNNRTYSACGLSISLGEEQNINDPQNAFGGVDRQNNGNPEDKENWKWKPGVCRVKVCGKKTLVGPCDVCHSCQAKFDRGEDPANNAKLESNKEETRRKKETTSVLGWSRIDEELHEMIDQQVSMDEKEKGYSAPEKVLATV